MKGGKASLKEDMCLEIQDSRIKTLSHWNKKEKESVHFVTEEDVKNKKFDLNSEETSFHL